jgi:predicted amidohydrolase/N-acetylneuraminic acid mutarotase
VDGLFYIIGGTHWADRSMLRTTFAYDPKNNAWQRKKDMPTPRWFPSATAVNGIIYVIGGGRAPLPVVELDTVEAYDPRTDTWAVKSPITTPRGGLATCEVDGIIYALGGLRSAGSPTRKVEAYDPASDQWSPRKDMPVAGGFLQARAVGGIIYAFLGNKVYAYDPKADAWTAKTAYTPWNYGMMSAVEDGIIYLFGGMPEGMVGAYKLALAYDPALDRFSTRRSMPRTRVLGACGVIDGKIYIAGGQSAEPILNSTAVEYTVTDVFDPRAEPRRAQSVRLFKADFAEPNLSQWTTMGTGGLRTNLNQQLLISANCDPFQTNNGFATHFILGHEIPTPAVLTNGWTVEGRADLVRANQNDVWASVHFSWNTHGNSGYIFWKDEDELALAKFWDGGSSVAWFFYEQRPVKNSNATLVLTLTRRDSDLVLNSRVLDRGNGNAILFDRTVVDTAKADSVLPTGAARLAPGVQDLVGEPWRLISGPGIIEATLDWVNSEDAPNGPAEVTYDNIEVWLYQSPQLAQLRAASNNDSLNLSWDDEEAKLEEAATILGSWQTTVTTNTTCQVSLPSTASRSCRFYRLKTPPPGRKWLTVAAVSMTSLPDTEANLQTMYSSMEQAASNGVDLIVFPELALQGSPAYGWAGTKPTAQELEYTRETAEIIPGLSTSNLISKARELNQFVICGMVEKDSSGKLYNSAVFLGPSGVIGTHRKTLEPGNLLWSLGNQLIQVFDSPIGAVGIMICAEMGGESGSLATAPGPRLAADGAVLLVTCTSWPSEASGLYDDATKGNAQAAKRWHVVADEVGRVGYFQVIGHSRIVDPLGRVVRDTGTKPGIVCWSTDIIVDAQR